MLIFMGSKHVKYVVFNFQNKINGHSLWLTSSASFLAEISISAPRKLFIFIISKKKSGSKYLQKTFYFILKKEALLTSASSAGIWRSAGTGGAKARKGPGAIFGGVREAKQCQRFGRRDGAGKRVLAAVTTKARPAFKRPRLRCLLQCFPLSRIIGKVAPKIYYFRYLKKYFLDQSIQKIVYLILKKEALVCAPDS